MNYVFKKRKNIVLGILFIAIIVCTPFMFGEEGCDDGFSEVVPEVNKNTGIENMQSKGMVTSSALNPLKEKELMSSLSIIDVLKTGNAQGRTMNSEIGTIYLEYGRKSFNSKDSVTRYSLLLETEGYWNYENLVIRTQPHTPVYTYIVRIEFLKDAYKDGEISWNMSQFSGTIIIMDLKRTPMTQAWFANGKCVRSTVYPYTSPSGRTTCSSSQWPGSGSGDGGYGGVSNNPGGGWETWTSPGGIENHYYEDEIEIPVDNNPMIARIACSQPDPDQGWEYGEPDAPSAIRIAIANRVNATYTRLVSSGNLTHQEREKVKAQMDIMMQKVPGIARLINMGYFEGVSIIKKDIPTEGVRGSYNHNERTISLDVSLFPGGDRQHNLLMTLIEEYFHVIQYEFYISNGYTVGPYESGNTNIEFEAKVLLSMISAHDRLSSLTKGERDELTLFAILGSSTEMSGLDIANYDTWIDSFNGSGSFNLYDILYGGSYFYYMNSFYNGLPEGHPYRRGGINPNLNPGALIEVLFGTR